MYGLNDKPTVWVVDDDKSIRWVLDKALQKSRLPYKMFADGQEAIDALQAWQRQTPQNRQPGDYPALLLSDICMPNVSGISLLQEFKKMAPDVPVVMMTAHADLDNAVSTFQMGAAEYIAKPFDTDELMLLLKRFLQPSPQVSMDEAASGMAHNFGLLGQSPRILQVLRTIGRLSATQVNVLLTGETGTGKELVARALHNTSTRAVKPFIAISTAAIPAHLLESELFGHEEGAFIGATSARVGRFEEAAGGTLFLDEIGDMPLDLQARLLRVLSEGVFYRVGGNELIKADVRVIAASHQDLALRVAQGQFRADLYHRLNVVGIHLPPLRERSEDIGLLMQHFLMNAAKELGQAQPKKLSASAVVACQSAYWPGNIRQLDNVCRWLSVMVPTHEVNETDLPNEVHEATVAIASESLLSESTQNTVPAAVYWQDTLELAVDKALQEGQPAVMIKLQQQFEQVVIMQALKHTQNHRQKAAQLLGVGRNTITRKVKK